MKLMKFEFGYFKKNNYYYPVIDIFIRNIGNTKSFRALVDSGATFSVFNIEVAELLDVNIEKGLPIYLEGIGGRILGYVHKLKISIDNKKFFDCKIIFSSEVRVSFNLLGRDNFFEPFVISFYEKQKKIILGINK
jgi:hypothetical protein